jgi:hypothetical protein
MAISEEELRNEHEAIKGIMRSCRHQRRMVYVALEDMNFIWDARDVEQFDHMWREGLSLIDIARALDRDPDEVALLVMDRARKGRVQSRRGGIFGNRRSNRTWLRE